MKIEGTQNVASLQFVLQCDNSSGDAVAEVEVPGVVLGPLDAVVKEFVDIAQDGFGFFHIYLLCFSFRDEVFKYLGILVVINTFTIGHHAKRGDDGKIEFGGGAVLSRRIKICEAAVADVGPGVFPGVVGFASSSARKNHSNSKT